MLKYLGFVVLLFSSCTINKYYYSNNFFDIYSAEDIQTMVMLDYIQHTRPKCKNCKIYVNGLIKHYHFNDKSNREYENETEHYKFLNYDPLKVIDLRFKGYEISGFGTINFYDDSLKFEDVYHFTPVVFDKENKIIYCQLLRNEVRYAFAYSVIGDKIILSYSKYIEDGY